MFSYSHSKWLRQPGLNSAFPEGTPALQEHKKPQLLPSESKSKSQAPRKKSAPGLYLQNCPLQMWFPGSAFLAALRDPPSEEMTPESEGRPLSKLS